MGRGADGYVNLLSHSPVDAPCPGYRYRESRDNLLDEAAPLMATTPPAMREEAKKNSPDVLCPVLIHVYDPAIRERRRCTPGHRTEKRYRRTLNDRSKKWIDLDENVLDDYVLIDDKNLGPSVPKIDSEELPYPEYGDGDNDDDDDDDDDDDGDDDEDTGSHSRRECSMYKRLKKSTSKRHWPDVDFGATYPLANSHGNAYQDSSSHSKYTELYSEFRRSNLDAFRDLDVTSYVAANSHGEHGDPTTDIRNRGYRESLDNLTRDTRPTDVNYEVANSHSNYRVFYDSQTQHQAAMPASWSSELWPENRRDSRATSEGSVALKRDEERETNTSQSEKKTEQDSGTTCDIEQCLVQIEESLLNIEQNLLHVQDLDIPELRNLLYKSPSIERSLYEVQDLLYADGIVPVTARDKSMSLGSDEEEEEEDEEEVEEEEVWIGQNITIKDNDEDGNADAPPLNLGSSNESADTVDERNHSRSLDDHYVDWIDGSNVTQEERPSDSNDRTGPMEKAMNFVPNSLGKTPRRIVLDEVKENIRLCSSEPEESTITIDYNLNSACAEKKSLFRDKWHSRTNSLDENSSFQNPGFASAERSENGKSSLRNIFLESAGSRRLRAGMKAHSEGALQTDTSERHRRGSHEEKLLQAVEATAEDFRKKLESFASQRRSIILADKRKRMTAAKEDSAVSRSREKSPTKSKRTMAARNQDKDNGKNASCDKRKRKKTCGKNQSSSENALEPSKLISLSLSLLLAALLQAVRCLTDLVEDAFRSVSYDKSGLLQ